MPSLKGPIIGLIGAPLLTWLTYATALQIEAGTYKEPTGRKVLYKKMLAGAAEALGPSGSLAVGGLVCAGMVAWLIVTLKKRKEAAAKA
jgi:hypothetical protein